jgi:hypothetical protein
VDESEIRRLLGIIEGRIETAMSGARWQRHITESLFKTVSPDDAFRTMLSLYMANQKKNTPIHEWTLSP